jgi:hypothetical protein
MILALVKLPEYGMEGASFHLENSNYIGKNREGKILRQMYKSYRFFNNQTSLRLNKLIHNNDKIKLLRFAGQIQNPRPLWVSLGQSTFW